MKLRGGYATLATRHGGVWRLHLLTPFGAWLLAGFRFDPASVLGAFALLVVHAIGHAVVARGHGLRVRGVSVHGLGAHCEHDPGTPLQASAIAFGGVLAQGWAALIVEGVQLAGRALSPALVDDLHRMNLLLALVNLLPVAPLDGSRAWSLFAHLRWFARRPKVDPLPLESGPLDDPAAWAEVITRQALDDARAAVRASSPGGRASRSPDARTHRPQTTDPPP